MPWCVSRRQIVRVCVISLSFSRALVRSIPVGRSLVRSFARADLVGVFFFRRLYRREVF